MKKKIILLLFCLALGSWVFSGSWLDRYKRGDIVLKADASYGAKTDWADIFYDGFKRIAVAPDLSVFVSDIRQNKIYKFDKYGTLLKSFSQAGCGPGDVLQPSDLSILDGQYLVVSEGSDTNFRISIFDLNYKFIETVRATSYILKATALKDNKIAYLVAKITPDEYKSFTVMIADFRTKKTVSIATFKQKMRRSIFQAASYYGEVCLAQINGGDLLVGYSEVSNISIYSSEGVKKSSFKLNIIPIKVTTAMKNEFQQIVEKHAIRKSNVRHFLKQMDLDKIFPEYVPLYRGIMVDCENNILVVKHNGFDINTSMDFQVYSQTGQHVCDSRIQFKEFKLTTKLPFSFQKNAIYGILETEEEDDSLFRIVKVNVQ